MTDKSSVEYRRGYIAGTNDDKPDSEHQDYKEGWCDGCSAVKSCPPDIAIWMFSRRQADRS